MKREYHLKYPERDCFTIWIRKFWWFMFDEIGIRL